MNLLKRSTCPTTESLPEEARHIGERWPDRQCELAGDRCIAGELVLIERRPCMSTVFRPEHVDEQVGRAVQDPGCVPETGRSVDEAEQANDPGDPIEISHNRLGHCEMIDRHQPCRPIAVFNRDLGANLAHDGEDILVVFAHGRAVCAGQIEKAGVLDPVREAADWMRGPRQRDPQFGETSFHMAGHAGGRPGTASASLRARMVNPIFIFLARRLRIVPLIDQAASRR
jgi:hypothetical protein